MRLTPEQEKAHVEALMAHHTDWLMSEYTNPVDQELAFIQHNAMMTYHSALNARTKLKELECNLTKNVS